MHKKITLLAILIVGLLYGCSTDKFKETESGLNYKLVKKGDGTLPF